MNRGLSLTQGRIWLYSVSTGVVAAGLLSVTERMRCSWLVAFLDRILAIFMMLADRLLGFTGFWSRQAWLGWLPGIVFAALAFAALSFWLLKALTQQDTSPTMRQRWVLPAAAMVLLSFFLFIWPTPSTFVKASEKLYMACLAGDVERARLLLGKGADVNAGYYVGGSWAHDSTPLMAATLNGNADLVKLLLDRGADVNKRDSEGRSAVDYAITHHDIIHESDGGGKVLDLLLSRGGEMRAKPAARQAWDPRHPGGKEDFPQWSPLYTAAMMGNAQAVESLVKAGADVNAVEWDGGTALTIAAQRKNVKVVRYLLEHAADPNKVQPPGRTALEVAETPELTEVLLKAGADPNVKATDGDTPLMNAARWGRVEQAKLLLAAGADPNVSTAYGMTPLMFTARGGYPEVAKLLLEKGARTDARTTDGKNAMQMAKDGNHAEMVSLLQAAAVQEKSKNQGY